MFTHMFPLKPVCLFGLISTCLVLTGSASGFPLSSYLHPYCLFPAHADVTNN